MSTSNRMASLSVEEENYVRMSLLLTGISPRAARTFFDSEFDPACLYAALKKEYCNLMELKSKHRINQSQWSQMFPRFPDVPDSKTFDIQLMITLLRNFTNITHPHGGFDCLPTDIETTPGADLARIKYYRNYLAHLVEVKIGTTDFNTAWEIISGAIGRLGGQHMKEDCDQLRTKTLDQTNREIMMDIKRSNEEIRELRESLDSLKRSHEVLQNNHIEMTKEVKRLKSVQNDTVPWNVRERTKETLKSWKDNDDKMFITTRAAQKVLKSIKENSCVTITASSGVGKTVTLRHVALQMAEEEYDVLLVTDPGDIVKFNNTNKKTLFVVDDLCGNFSVNQSDIKSWEPVIEEINQMLEKHQTKILAACRLQVYQDEKFESLSIFTKSCVCNMLSENMCLSKSEKQSIAELYLKTEASAITDYYNLYDCFPLLCKLYHDNPNFNVTKFFRKPFSVYEAEIEKLHKKGHNTKYCALALCVIFNNKLKDEMLTEEVNEETKIIFENTFEACRLDRGTSRFVLLDELNSLKDTFIKKSKNIYKIIHDKIFDFLTYYFGQKIITCLIKNANSGLIKERFSLEKTDCLDEFITVIPQKYHHSYIQRMISDWSNGKIQDVFNNINMQMSNFRQQFLIHLYKLDKFHQRQLAHICNKPKHRESIDDENYNDDDEEEEEEKEEDDDEDDDNDNDEDDSVLLKCCVIGDIDLVRWCFKLGVDVNKRNFYGVSSLMKACEHGHTEIVKMLLDRGADCNTCDWYGESPVTMSCEHGHTEVVKILLDRGAAYDNCDMCGQSPVMMSCKHGHTEVVKMLLDRRVDLNKCDERGQSPLMMACAHGHKEIVKMLLDRGAECDECDLYGESPLMMSCKHDKTEIIELLLNRGVDCNRCDRCGQSPLMIACAHGHTEIVKMLLDRGADFNTFDERGQSPLMISCAHGHTEIVKMLLDRGAEYDKCDKLGHSSVMKACTQGHTEIVKLLLDRGADYNRCDDQSALINE
ncbi:uncharacterized protein LOC134710178 [Mytilus trossulus]|uniref:uncharacterized protein LOC134710178 n=1 Tax=Mytilus trossulus TaxID=6551 RepID=UPI0030064933